MLNKATNGGIEVPKEECVGLECEVAAEVKRTELWTLGNIVTTIFSGISYVLAGLAVIAVFALDLPAIWIGVERFVEEYGRAPEFTWENINKFGPFALAVLFLVGVLRRLIPNWLNRQRWKKIHDRVRDMFGLE